MNHPVHQDSQGSQYRTPKSNPLVRARLQSLHAVKGSWREVAASLQVSQSYLSDVLSGKRAAGPKLLQPLGLRRVWTIEPLAPEAVDTGGSG